MRCGWCDRDDGLEAVELEPAVSIIRRAADGTLVDVQVKAPVMAWACDTHLGVVFDPEPDVQQIRRRKARGFQQLEMFDLGVNDVGQVHHGRDPSRA